MMTLFENFKKRRKQREDYRRMLKMMLDVKDDININHDQAVEIATREIYGAA